jgi:phosphorylcholine metabolism protein LicD
MFIDCLLLQFSTNNAAINILKSRKFNDINSKHKQKSAILTVWELLYDKLFILCWKIYRTVRDFYRTVRKISHCAGTCQ